MMSWIYILTFKVCQGLIQKNFRIWWWTAIFNRFSLRTLNAIYKRYLCTICSICYPPYGEDL